MEGNARIAYCGLYCPMCSHLVAAETKNRGHIDVMPQRYDRLKQRTFEECECAGCRIQTIKCHCAMKPCAEKKELISCADCTDFPCAIIEAFGHDGAPHHYEAYLNLWRIKEVGYDVWIKEMEAQKYCECGKRQSWYYICTEHKND